MRPQLAPPPALQAALREALDPSRVRLRYLDRIAYASDASVYRQVPLAVAQPATLAEVRHLFRLARQWRLPLVFRAAGTSLSGQAVTDGILVDVSRYWRRVEVLEGGARVRVEPGVRGGYVNRLLAPYHRKIGPDPASIDACMMGGILANNSSGMCCGVAHNAYHTLESMKCLLPQGTLVDGAAPDAEERLATEAPEIAQGLRELKRRIEADRDLTRRIRHKYRMKNTVGYSLNAFLDFETPVQILQHLMIGSEGTLGFIAEAVLRTVPDPPLKTTGLLFFRDLSEACSAIEPLQQSGAVALELMDRASLASVEDAPGVPAGIRELPAGAAALLVEYAEEDTGALASRAAAFAAAAQRLRALGVHGPTCEADARAALWRVRQGLIASVGARRPRGTSMIIEDVVFPVARLARAVVELQALLREHGYDAAIIFGHAKDGNLHFVLTQAFDTESEIERYDRFMRALAELVVHRHAGALKAEHGTGRNMAPFVETEWGPAATAVMRALKQVVDPEGILNPGVVVSDDPRAHLRHLKTLPEIAPEVDACIECGFCERVCPSRDLTLTPRQRIAVRRELARLAGAGAGREAARELEADFAYDGLETCAADGLCALACPVGIDTGRLVKRLRGEAHGVVAREWARMAAERIRRLGGVARALVALARCIPAPLRGYLPPYDPQLPPPAPPLPHLAAADEARAVYVPCCPVRVFGPDGGMPPLPEVVGATASRAGWPLWIPEGCEDVCCGLPFASRGYAEAAREALGRFVRALWRWSERGRRPLVLDTTPCTYTLRAAELDGELGELRRQMEILDGLEFAERCLVPSLRLRAVASAVVLHPVCSATKLGLASTMERLAARCAQRVVIPLGAGCCGFAGDRGWRVPELTAAAAREEAQAVLAGAYDGYYSSSRTCEHAMRRATGRPYRSLWYLLEEASRA